MPDGSHFYILISSSGQQGVHGSTCRSTHLLNTVRSMGTIKSVYVNDCAKYFHLYICTVIVVVISAKNLNFNERFLHFGLIRKTVLHKLNVTEGQLIYQLSSCVMLCFPWVAYKNSQLPKIWLKVVNFYIVFYSHWTTTIWPLSVDNYFVVMNVCCVHS